MPNLHPEECWGGGLGTAEMRYFDFWAHDTFLDQLFFPDHPDLWGLCDPESTGNGETGGGKVSQVSYGITEIMNIEPQLITKTSRDGLNHYFRIPASEIKEAMPELVKSKNDVDYVNQVALISVLINVVKDQQLEIEELKGSISSYSTNSLEADKFDYSQKLAFDVVPNPVEQNFQLLLNNDSPKFNGILVISDLAGNRLQTFSVTNGSTAHSFTLDSDKVAAGIFLFSLISEENMTVVGSKRVFVK